MQGGGNDERMRIRFAVIRGETVEARFQPQYFTFLSGAVDEQFPAADAGGRE
jgi:hypothetical protein